MSKKQQATHGKLAILVDSEIVNDSRVQKHYFSAKEFGYAVIGLGFTNNSTFEPKNLPGVKVLNRLGLKKNHDRVLSPQISFNAVPEKISKLNWLISPTLAATPKRLKSIFYVVILLNMNFIVLRWLRKERPARVLVNDPHFLWAASQYKNKNKQEIKIMYDSHENFEQYQRGSPENRMLHYLEIRFAKYADSVSCVSPSISEVMSSNLGLKRPPAVILNCSRLDWLEKSSRNIRKDCGVEKDVPLLVYSGMVSSSRGTEDILDALVELQGVSMAFVVDKHPDTRKYLGNMITKRNLSSRCKVLDYVPPSQLESYLEDADVGVVALRKIDSKGRHNSEHDFALPNKLFDYWNAGLRLVFSNCAEMMRVTTNDSASFSFESNSTQSLVHATNSAISAQVPKDREPIYWENQSEVLSNFYRAA